MKILIIRHSESVKNINETFSNEKNSETLTANGISNSKEIAHELKMYLDGNDKKINQIYASNSVRAIHTAKIIGKELGVDVTKVDEFTSIKYSSLNGCSLNEAEIKEPHFHSQLSLYRDGVFNAYDFNVGDNIMSQQEYELIVVEKLKSILYEYRGDLLILLVHHSTLTAIIIFFARIAYNYPTNFYGRIECDPGNSYLVEYSSDLSCSFLFSNMEAKFLNNRSII